MSGFDLERRVHGWWYRAQGWTPTRLLRPLVPLYAAASSRRRRQGRMQASTIQYPAPVLVVGNLTAGGAGKTPLVIAIANHLASRGLRVGIVSRGYGRKGGDRPADVAYDSDPRDSGDEPLLIARQTGLPVVVARDRNAAIRHLLSRQRIELVISDDGLQHYRMPRDIEIAVVDSRLGFGNGLLLPAGPLRELPRRLDSVDYVVLNGREPRPELDPYTPWRMDLVNSGWQQIASRTCLPMGPRPFSGRVHAVTGIANPERFFASLEALGLTLIRHAFPDHHAFRRSDLDFRDGLPVVMTAKDAVKCVAFASDNCWALEVEARLPEPLLDSLEHRVLEQRREGKHI